MADNDQPDSLILRMLRSLDNKMDDLGRKMDALQSHSLAGDAVTSVKGETLLALRKDIQALDVRVSRVETRLNLRDQLAEINPP